MVEHVARAIAEGLAVDYGAQSVGYQAQLRQAARLAIAAMRHITPEMSDAGFMVSDPEQHMRLNAEAIWRAMIDAAARDV